MTTSPPAAPVRETEHEFSLVLRLQDHYTQIVDFGLAGVTTLVTDEPPPLGQGGGPNPARLLGAAVGSCLGASLLYCLRKAHVDVTDLRTTVADRPLPRAVRGLLRGDGERAGRRQRRCRGRADVINVAVSRIAPAPHREPPEPTPRILRPLGFPIPRISDVRRARFTPDAVVSLATVASASAARGPHARP